MSSNKRTNAFLIVLAIVVPLLLVAEWVRRTGKGAAKSPVAPVGLIAKWAAGASFPIKDTEEFNAQVQRAVAAKTPSDSLLTSDQQAALGKALSAFVKAYAVGSFEVYERFRFPVSDGKYDEDRIRELLRKLDNAGVRPPGMSDKNPREVIKQTWNTYGKQGEYYCTDCWESVDLSSVEIVSMDAGRHGTLSPFVRKGDHIGSIMTWNPLFRFDINDAAGASPEPIKSVAIHFVVKEKSGSAYPAYIYYDWRSDAKKWLPREVALAYFNEKHFYLF